MKRFGISQRNRSRGNRTWYGRIFDTETGETSYVSLGTTSRQNALDWLAKANAERFLPKRSEPKNPAIATCAEAYLKNVGGVRRRDPGTLAIYSRYLGELSRFCREQGIAGISDFSARSANDFMATLARKSPQTVSCEIGALRSFFRWAIDDFDISMKNPFRNIHPPRIAQKPREFWTVEECERIVSAETDPEYRCFFALMAFAGLRRTEAQKIRAEDVAGGKLRVTGKRGKYSSLPVGKRLARHLGEYAERSGIREGVLFPRLSKIRADNRHLAATAERAGLSPEGAHFHRFRHSFASNLLVRGASIKAVQLLMRHENVTLTLSIYSHLLPSDLEAAADSL